MIRIDLIYFICCCLQRVSYNECYTTRITWQLLPFCFNLSDQSATETMFWTVNSYHIFTAYLCMTSENRSVYLLSLQFGCSCNPWRTPNCGNGDTGPWCDENGEETGYCKKAAYCWNFRYDQTNIEIVFLM